MHFNKQRLRSPRQLTSLLMALDFDLWLPQGHALLQRSEPADPAVPETAIKAGKQQPARPAAEQPAATSVASTTAKTAKKPISTPAIIETEAPEISLALARMPGLLWVLEQRQWPAAQSLLREVALFQGSTDALHAIPFVWPQPDIPVDQNASRAVEALEIRIKNLQQPEDRLAIVGEIPQQWLSRCNLVSADAIVFSTLAGLMGQAAEKRRLWRALIAAGNL